MCTAIPQLRVFTTPPTVTEIPAHWQSQIILKDTRDGFFVSRQTIGKQRFKLTL